MSATTGGCQDVLGFCRAVGIASLSHRVLKLLCAGELSENRSFAFCEIGCDHLPFGCYYLPFGCGCLPFGCLCKYPAASSAVCHSGRICLPSKAFVGMWDWINMWSHHRHLFVFKGTCLMRLHVGCPWSVLGTISLQFTGGHSSSLELA